MHNNDSGPSTTVHRRYTLDHVSGKVRQLYKLLLRLSLYTELAKVIWDQHTSQMGTYFRLAPIQLHQ